MQPIWRAEEQSEINPERIADHPLMFFLVGKNGASILLHKSVRKIQHSFLIE